MFAPLVLANGVVTSVASSTDVQTLLPASMTRLGATIYNDSTAVLYLKLGTAASSASFTAKVGSEGYYEMPYRYLGVVTGVWASVNGSARITEFI